jgi:hypothetical protein
MGRLSREAHRRRRARREVRGSGDRAAARYQRAHGKPPKNQFGTSLHAVSVAEALRWARSARQAVVVDAVPRYLPSWTRPLVRIPLVREFLTWNLLLVLRREG